MLKNRVARPRLSTALLVASLLVAASNLTGCALAPIQDDRHVLATVAGPELSKADALLAEGKLRQAADAYLTLASKAQPPARAQLKLMAARAYLASAQTAKTSQILDSIALQELTPAQQELRLLTRADLALLQSRPKDAVRELEQMHARSLPKNLKAKRLGSLAAAHRATGATVEAAYDLDELDSLLEQHGERLTNQASLVSTLSTLGESRLRQLASNGKGSMKGWAEIALLTHQASADPSRLEDRIQTWQQAHQGHPALPEFARSYAEIISGSYKNGDQITVILPRGGRFAAAAAAVRDGIEAASRADTGQQPDLVFADSTSAGAAHAKATKSGADFVIGPLEKSAVDELIAGHRLPIPTLALNEATQTSTHAENLFQFSLSPENEATEVANKAFAMGLRSAALVYPEGAWGNRMASAFKRQWQNLGGTLAGQSSVNPAWSNYEKTLSKLFNGKEIDLVLLVATAEMARKIHPDIQRLAAKSVKVISTSHVYSGGFDRSKDQGLIGLYFVDIPWMLDAGGDGPLARRRLIGKGAASSDPLARLHAMGIDAYRLAPRLTELSKTPGSYYLGQTGGLSIDGAGRIQRQLELGRYTDAGPVLIDVIPAQ